MAVLKAGSTVGGNLILHQGLLPLYPNGDSLYYKNYKIYTEKNKPTPEELNIFTKTQINQQYSTIGGTGSTENWYQIGTLRTTRGSQTVYLTISGGTGYNGIAAQNSKADIIIRVGNGETEVGKKGRISMSIFTAGIGDNVVIVDGAIVETSAGVYEVYFKLNSYTSSSVIEVTAGSIEDVNTIWTKTFVAKTPATTNMDVAVVKMYSTANKPTKTDVGLSNVTNDVQVKKAGDTMTGALNVNTTGTGVSVAIKSEMAFPLTIERTNDNKNVAIGFKNTGATRYLGFGQNGKLHWGINTDASANGQVYTTEFKPTWIDVQAWRQGIISIVRGTNLNDITDPGSYYQDQNADASTSLNYPEATAGTLNVFKTAGSGGGIIQEYKIYNKNLTYSRRRTNATTWSGWSKTYSEENKPTNSDLNLVSRNGDTMNGNLVMNANVLATNREVVAGTFIVGDTAAAKTRTYLSSWTQDANSTGHRFEIFARGTSAPNTRKNIMTADITDVNQNNASLLVTFAGDIRADGNINAPGGEVVAGPAVKVGTASHGGMFRGNGDGASWDICNLDFKSWFGIGVGTDVNGTYVRHLVINARNGDLTTKGAVHAAGEVRCGSQMFMNNIRKVNGTEFIAADGNINLPNATNGWNAGWLLQQINSRINTAQTTADNANNNANGRLTQATADNRYKKKTKGWTRVFGPGNIGHDQVANLSQDVRFRTIWFKSNSQASFASFKFGPDGQYYMRPDPNWIRMRLQNGGRQIYNIQDDSTTINEIWVENE